MPRKSYLWNWYEYTPEYLREELSENEVKEEYKRLRVIANRRLKSLEKAGLTDTQAYLKNVGKYPAASKVSLSTLPERLYQLSKFLQSSQSTPSGRIKAEKQTISTLHKSGYRFVNKGNLKAFGDFMEKARQEGLSRGKISSERVAKLFGIAEKRGISPDEVKENFKLFLDNSKRLQGLSVDTAEEMSSDEILEYLNGKSVKQIRKEREK